MARTLRGHMTNTPSRTVKVRTYHIKRALKFVGDDKEFPSLSQLTTRALDEFVTNLEASQK